MLTNGLYTVLTRLLVGEESGQYYIAVGAGKAEWDSTAFKARPEQTVLVNEIARKEVRSEDVVYLDERDEVVREPTVRLRISAHFGNREGVGTWRECGLFLMDASLHEDSGSLLSYHVHPRIDKTANMEVERTFRIDLTPRELVPGQAVTRYLGNSNSREIHDLENVRPNCQIDEIRFDRVVYFEDLPGATAAGYDPCANCFGRDQSQR